MAWVSPKVYAILSSSEEGKDILEGIGEKTQDEVDKELDAFFSNGGKGESSSEDYKKAKDQDEADRKSWESQNDMDDEDYERAWGPKEDEDEDDDGEVSEDEISEALADGTWTITDGETVGQYAQQIADQLHCTKDQVLKVIRNEDANISEEDSMAKVAGLEDNEETESDDPIYSHFRNKFNVSDKELDELRGYDYNRKTYKDNGKLSWRDPIESWADPVKDFAEEHNVSIEDVEEFLNRAYDRTNKNPLKDGTDVYGGKK